MRGYRPVVNDPNMNVWRSQFCFPEGITVISSSNPKAASHTHGAFVLTDSNGASSYGYSLTFFEPIKDLPSTSSDCFSIAMQFTDVMMC